MVVLLHIFHCLGIYSHAFYMFSCHFGIGYAITFMYDMHQMNFFKKVNGSSNKSYNHTTGNTMECLQSTMVLFDM